MTLTSVTLTFDPVRSLLGPSLMHQPSLDEIGLGVFEIWEIFQYDLDQVTLTSDLVRSLLGPSLMHIPSLDEIGLGVFEISKIFEYDLDPSDFDL